MSKKNKYKNAYTAFTLKIRLFRPKVTFLAVQDSSIGDLVTH